MSWITDSNRLRHFIGCLAVSYIGTMLMGIGCGGGMEFKDVQYHNSGSQEPIWKWDWSAWDWVDFAFSVAGSIVGQALQLLTVLLVVKIFF